MNTFSLASLPKNPFNRSEFWGRNRELRTLYRRLISEPPQCSALIGGTFIGKTTLLHHLAKTPDTTILDDQAKEHTFTCVYLDCNLSVDAEPGDYASAQFWWKLYIEACDRLQHIQHDKLTEPEINAKQDELVNYSYAIKITLEELVRDHPHPVIFVFDNFEIVARLPTRNSEWLRSLVRSNCAYIVASRYLLYLLYQYTRESWANPSPLYNLFSDPIYLGLMAEAEVDKYLLEASSMAKEQGSTWEQRDIDFIKFFCGRHPELIRIGCSHMFETHLQAVQNGELKDDDLESTFLEERIFNDARTICNQIWNELADPELQDEPRIEGSSKEENTHRLFPYQKNLIEIAKGMPPIEKKILFVLEQRGLIERVDGKWRVFAEVMRQFVLNKEALYVQDRPVGEKQQLSDTFLSTVEQSNATGRREITSFTYLEGKVYDYLKSHIGEVCDREDIKRAVWQNNPPSNTALQKIIERIRDKIEPGVDNPSYLIAIRGQGYMLRELPTSAP